MYVRMCLGLCDCMYVCLCVCMHLCIYLCMSGSFKRPRFGSLFKLGIPAGGLTINYQMSPRIWLRAYGSGHVAPGIFLRAHGSRHMAPGIWLPAYGSRHMAPGMWFRASERNTACAPFGCPRCARAWLKGCQTYCAQHLVNREVHRCVLRIAMCYENVACAALDGKLAVKRVHVQRLVNRGPFQKQAPAVKPCCG